MTTASRPCVVFSHGLDGEPWGTKIVALARVAEARGYAMESVDYRGMEAPARVEKLIQVAGDLPPPLVLVGSSLGGHVAATASTHVPTAWVPRNRGSPDAIGRPKKDARKPVNRSSTGFDPPS